MVTGPVVVIVTLPAPPWAIAVELGEAEIEKSGVGTAVTVRFTVVPCDVLPPVPVMVIA